MIDYKCFWHNNQSSSIFFLACPQFFISSISKLHPAENCCFFAQMNWFHCANQAQTIMLKAIYIYVTCIADFYILLAFNITSFSTPQITILFGNFFCHKANFSFHSITIMMWSRETIYHFIKPRKPISRALTFSSFLVKSVQ